DSARAHSSQSRSRSGVSGSASRPVKNRVSAASSASPLTGTPSAAQARASSGSGQYGHAVSSLPSLGSTKRGPAFLRSDGTTAVPLGDTGSSIAPRHGRYTE